MTTNELIRELRASNQRETFTLRLTDEQAIALLEQWTTTELARVKAERGVQFVPVDGKRHSVVSPVATLQLFEHRQAVREFLTL